MTFSEKLNFLFKLTNSEGKALAAALNITPPQISKMRNGLRGMPRDRESSRKICLFFAERCGSDYLRDRLAEESGIPNIRGIEKIEELAGVIGSWLSYEENPSAHAAGMVTAFLQQFGSASDLHIASPAHLNQTTLLSQSGASFFTFFGNAGRREAVLRFFQHLIKLKKPLTVNLLTDESQSWITETSDFSAQLQSSLMLLSEQGCIFHRIAAPITDINQAFESLNRWFPLYMTGKANSFYYSRMRDSLNRITIFVVRNEAALFSFSVGAERETDAATFFTTDRDTVNSLSVQFDRYAALCEPIMRTYSSDLSSERLMSCLIDYDASRASCFQLSNSLSVITLPWDIAITLRADNSPEKKQEFLDAFARRHKSFAANLKEYPFVDIIRLADLQSIMDGRVTIAAGCVLSGKPQYYTAAGYLQHLGNILFLLEHQKNYHVVVRSPEDTDPAIVYVKDGLRAVLIKDAYPFSVFEVSERHLIGAFTEYLQRMIPDDCKTPVYRRSVISAIKALIVQIEQAIQQAAQSHKSAPAEPSSNISQE